MTKRLVRTFNFIGAFAMAAVVAACTVHTTETPGLTGPSENVGPISLPAQTPTARFTITPTAPAANSIVAFDGTPSCPGPADPASTTTACIDTGATLTAYTWDFGDGQTASGAVVNHSYSTAGSYAPRLTVTNSSGRSHTGSKAVTVAAGLLPTAVISFSPQSPKVGAPVFFSGSTSTPGAGHTIVGWAWNFGDGTQGSGVTPFQTTGKVYGFVGNYVVTLTVIDEAGQTRSTTTGVNVTQ